MAGALAAAAWVAGSAWGGEAAAPARGGGPLLAAAEEAPLVVVGTVGELRPLDEVAWVAPLVVERSLRGSRARGETLRIAWEEPASHRPVRFRAGERVALALEPLPEWSVWRERLPEGDAWAVAARGRAFWRDPEPGTLELLGRFVALEAGARDGESGIRVLARLVADGAGPLASAALERLARTPGLETHALSEAREATEAREADVAKTLSRALLDPERPQALRRALLDLAGRRKLAGLGPAVERLAGTESPLRAPALEARARIDGGLGAERTAALLESADPEVRAVAVRFAPPELEPDPAALRVTGGSREDPSPAVRAAAARALVERGGLEAFDRAAPALFDPSREVRGAAAIALGELGGPAVPRLVALVEARSGAETAGPILALHRAGPAGAEALRALAAGHPDPRVRGLAGLALGRMPDAH